MKIFHKRLTAFSLIEISIVLIIIGLITATIFKGQDLIESARLQATVQEMNQIKLSMLQYRDQFGYIPGNDPKATQRFGSASNGSGNGVLNQTESSYVWAHLKAAGLLDIHPSAKIGGYFLAVGNPAGLQGNWIALSGKPDNLAGSLTPLQAMRLKAKAGESSPSEGQFIIKSSPGHNQGACFSGDSYAIENKSPACIVFLKL